MKLAKLTDLRLHSALRKLSAMPMPLRVAFKLKGIQVKVDEELKKFEEVRRSAIEKFGKRDDKGELVTKENGSVDFEVEQLRAFAAELNDLGQMDVDLPSVNINDLGDKVELSTDELLLLDGLIVE